MINTIEKTELNANLAVNDQLNEEALDNISGGTILGERKFMWKVIRNGPDGKNPWANPDWRPCRYRF